MKLLTDDIVVSPLDLLDLLDPLDILDTFS